jgi:hypothetical protein
MTHSEGIKALIQTEKEPKNTPAEGETKAAKRPEWNQGPAEGGKMYSRPRAARPGFMQTK